MIELQENQYTKQKGYFTNLKFLWGTVRDFEAKLGYHRGRLENGFFVAHLMQLPKLEEFELAGYSNRPSHLFSMPTDLEIKKLKEIALEEMKRIGFRNLVKIFPDIRHNARLEPDYQYPVGQGIPQWNLITPVPMFIYKKIEANKKGNVFLHKF